MSPSDASFYEMKARIIAVMANAKRLQIVEILGEGEKTVSELSEEMELAQAATSQHLAVMRKAGVVETTRDGNHIRYRLADLKVARACGEMSQAVVNIMIRQREKLQPVIALAKKRR